MTEKKLSWWETEGVICDGGWHPLGARIRAGNVFDNEEELYEWEYSEERVLRVKSLGINLIISQFDRGLGETDQAEDQERAKCLAELCHKHGLKIGGYMANTIYFESVMKDHPECDDWVVHTYDGRYVHFGGEQSWRWVACFMSPGWRARMKRAISKAVNYAQLDWLHFDNLAVWPEPDSCHCKYCQEAFHKFLRQRYPTPEAQKRRFGFSGFDTFRAPNYYLRFIEPWDLDRIESPLLQEWVEFRCWQVTDYIRDMAEYARSLKPDIAIEANGPTGGGYNHGFIHGQDPTAQGSLVDVVCQENSDYRLDSDPDAAFRVETNMSGMNIMRRLGKQVFTAYTNDERLARNITFGGCPGINMHWGYAEPRKDSLRPAEPGVTELLAHYLRHRQLYTRAKPLARIGIWRNQRSLALISFDTHLSVAVMEHLLMRRRIPFSSIQDQWINPVGLESFDLIIVPDVEYVSDEQLATLTAFVKERGSLLITEHSAAYDGDFRIRHEPAFAPLFQSAWQGGGIAIEQTGNFDPQKQFEMVASEGKSVTTRYGAGRAAYLAKIRYKYGPRAFKSRHNVRYDSIDSRYRKDPYNADEILDLIRWLYPDCEPVKIYGNPELRSDWVGFHDGDQGCLMMRCGELKSPANIRFAVRADTEPRNSCLHVPEKTKPVPLTWEPRGPYYETFLPNVMRHAIVKYSL